MKLYILDSENRPVKARNLVEWGQWFEISQNRFVGSTQVNSRITVSTVFLGIDHRHFGNGPPLLFETMVFGGVLDGHMWRYASWDDAATGHAATVKKVRAKTKAKI
jgi:hypothetical protein